MLQFKKLAPTATLPTKATKLSAGYDLCALDDTVVNNQLGAVLVKTGIAVKIPTGYYGRIALRSGLSYKQSMFCTAGVIDPDYRGDVGVVVTITKPDHEYVIKRGERFAQIIIEKIFDDLFVEVHEFDDNNLESHLGFGSTGK